MATSQRESHYGLDSHATHARSAIQMVEREAIELRSTVDLIWAGRAHWILGEYGACIRFGEAAVAGARETAPGLLPEALRLVATSSRAMGRWNAASTAASEGVELARALGQGMIHCALAALLAAIAAARGQAAACHGHAEEAIRIADELGLGVYGLRAERALALLALGSGRLDEAIDALTRIDRAVADSGNREFFISPAPDLIEALVRADRADDAQPILRGLEAVTSPEAGEVAIVGRCRALLDRGRLRRDPRAIHRQPCEVGQSVRGGAHRAVLRRAPAPGPPPPRGARAPCDRPPRRSSGLQPSRGRPARRPSFEQPTGTVRRPIRTADEELTPQELQIALHAAEGESNREIGAALFLSPRTVEFHLTRVYRKLNIHSRAELIRRFSAGQARPAD